MEVNRENLTVLDRDADSENYFKNLTENDLINTIENLYDFDDVSSALTELSARGKQAEVVRHSAKILEENLGDEFLQAVAFNLLYEAEVKKSVKVIGIRSADAAPALLAEMMNNLASNSLQPFENNLPKDLFMSIVKRFSSFDSKDQERISDDYDYFTEKYKNKLS